jgi:predicted protein tyrosine phosphatase
MISIKSAAAALATLCLIARLTGASCADNDQWRQVNYDYAPAVPRPELFYTDPPRTEHEEFIRATARQLFGCKWDPADINCDAPLLRTESGVVARPCDNQVQCIKSLCVGSEHAARNSWALDGAGITHVVDALGTCRLRHPRRVCLDLALEDTLTERRIIAALRRALDWRRESRAEHERDIEVYSDHVHLPDYKLFVHCAAGTSRTAALAINYLLEDDPSLDYDSALSLLRFFRPVSEPNPLFELALRLRHRLGVGEEAECALREALTGVWRNATAASDRPCACAPATCATAAHIYAEHGARLPPFYDASGKAAA